LFWEVVVNYALKGTSFEKIKKISSKHFRKAIKNALPEEIKIENDKFGKPEFEELNDYTEMKITVTQYHCVFFHFQVSQNVLFFEIWPTTFIL
jgi:hypothetical protein